MSKLARSLLASLALALSTLGALAQVVPNPSATGIPISTGGTVTSAACTPANGVTCSVSTAGTTPTFAIGLGAITPTSINGLTVSTTTGTLTVASGKTLTASNTLTLAGTDGKTFTLPTQNAAAVGFVGSNTYANTIASFPCNGTWSGYKAFVTDWGANGTEARCNGTRWLPTNGQTVLKRMGAAVSGIAGTETIATQVQLPIAAIQTGDMIYIRVSATKSGTTDTLAYSIRFGTAGTIADTAILSYAAATLLPAANQAGGFLGGFRVLSNTTARRTGSSNSSSSYGTVSVGTIASTTTVSDMSANAMWVSFTIKSSGVTDTVGAEEITITHEAG